MSHISRALSHATMLLALPLDVSIAPRSACVPAYVDCGRPIASLFCVNPIRANTKSYIARGRVGQTSDDERAQRGRKVHTNAKCDLKDSEVAPYESRTKTVSCTQVTYFALQSRRRTRRFLSSAKGSATLAVSLAYPRGRSYPRISILRYRCICLGTTI